MDDKTKQYWINRITKELKANKEPIWYDTTLVRKLKHWKRPICLLIVTLIVSWMILITFYLEMYQRNGWKSL